jgi:RHS repeat-associated protein
MPATSRPSPNSYYSADHRLAVVQRNSDQAGTAPGWEEYWYDALGRRVLTRSRHQIPTCNYPLRCADFVERTVWDGDQLLAEQRTSELDAITGGAPDHGTVRYVHLLGIDQPVAVLDSRFPDARVLHYNWRGLAEASSWADGRPADVELGGSGTIAWPAGQGVYMRQVAPPGGTPAPTWIGSLPENGQTGAGQLYRRNRYYDPASGRFTQEDPIGLAGGLNLYGFANGDPINVSDPFGLCGENIKKDEVKEKCRDATPEEGQKNADAAEAKVKANQKNGVTYPSDPNNPGSNEEDCSHFCSTAGHAGGLEHIPYHTTAQLADSKYYRPVPGSEARAGDIMWQPGHMGVYLGRSDDRGRPLGAQMGNRGARIAPFGPNGWFAGGSDLTYYRPLLPK